jgi:dienelactone hydrolase
MIHCTEARLVALVLLLACLPFHVGAQQGEALSEAELSALLEEGPYEVSGYSDVPVTEAFLAATIFFPWDAVEPVGGIAIVPGFMGTQDNIWWWGARLASHGYAVILLDTNDLRDQPAARAEALLTGIRVLRTENGRPDSPLYERLDATRMAVAGHSMGGGGALLAAERDTSLRAVIPFTPWLPQPEFETISTPTLIIAGEADAVAGVEAHAWPHFLALPESLPKLYVEVAGGDHYVTDTNRGTDLDSLSRYVLAWLGLHLNEDERYGAFLFGERPVGESINFSRYVENP